MLVLSARIEGPGIHIGNDILVRVLRSGYGGVRLGIEAPRDVKIWREEIGRDYRVQGQQNKEGVVADASSEQAEQPACPIEQSGQPRTPEQARSVEPYQAD